MVLGVNQDTLSVLETTKRDPGSLTTIVTAKIAVQGAIGAL